MSMETYLHKSLSGLSDHKLHLTRPENRGWSRGHEADKYFNVYFKVCKKAPQNITIRVNMLKVLMLRNSK